MECSSNQRFNSIDYSDPMDLMKVHGHYYDMTEEQQKEMQEREHEYMQLEETPNDPKHPCFYIVYSHTLPPEPAYRIVN